MSFVAVYCHSCELVCERAERNFQRSPFCEICRSEFIEVLSEANGFEAPAQPLPHHQRIRQEVEERVSVNPRGARSQARVGDRQSSRRSRTSTARSSRRELTTSRGSLQRSEGASRPGRLSSIRLRHGDLIGERCAICHEQYRENERVVTLPCNHMFHEGCVMQWLNDHNTCPVCRFNLPARTN